MKCLSSLSIRSPQLQRKLWMEQKKAFIRATTLIKALGKPTMTYAQAKRLDALGNNSKTSWNCIGRAAPVKHSIDSWRREASTASHCGWSSRKCWGTPVRRPLSWLCLALQQSPTPAVSYSCHLLLLPYPPPKKCFVFITGSFQSHQITKDFADVALRVYTARDGKGGTDNWLTSNVVYVWNLRGHNFCDDDHVLVVFGKSATPMQLFIVSRSRPFPLSLLSFIAWRRERVWPTAIELSVLAFTQGRVSMR